MRPRQVAVLLAVAAMLAGCVSPPSSGPIRDGRDAPVSGAVQPLVRPIANPPRPGMDPVEIVAGFLDAAAAVGDGFAVARQYLAPRAASTWDPGAGVTVTAGQSPQLERNGDTVTVRYVQVGTVSSSGVAAEAPPASGEQEVALAQVDGEWRITAPPPGLLLGRDEVDRAFAVRNAYFVDPSSRWAVPDVRVVPRTGAQAQATALVTALLAGPSQWLSDSVVTAIPSGLQLALGAVPVDNGVARIELSGPQPTFDDAAAQRFGAQLAWTLRQVPQVQAFEVLFDGRALPLGLQRGPVLLSEYERFNPDVLGPTAPLYGVGAAGSVLEVVGEAAVELTAPTAPDGSAAALSSIAVAPDGPVLAGAAADRTAVYIGRAAGGPGPGRWIAGQIGGRPSIDGQGRVWWTDPAGRVVAAVPDPEEGYRITEVAARGAPGPVALVRPARDGTRAVLVIGSGPAARAYLAAIVPDPSGPLLQGVRALGDTGGITDAAWHSADQVSLVIPGAGTVERTDLLGGSVAAFAVPADARLIADAPGQPIVLGLADGTAGRLTGSGVRIIEGLAAPAYPG